MNWPSPPMIRQQVTSQNPTAVFPHRLWPIAARGSRAYFPFAPLALEPMCRCPQVLGLTVPNSKQQHVLNPKHKINQVMLLFKTLKSQFHLNERSDLITCTPNTTNPNNFNKLLLRLFIVSDGHLQNQLSFLCFITCTCRFSSTATYSPRKKKHRVPS